MNAPAMKPLPSLERFESNLGEVQGWDPAAIKAFHKRRARKHQP